MNAHLLLVQYVKYLPQKVTEVFLSLDGLKLTHCPLLIT